ncbi:MAG TPA: tocopherol cyclase family protein [Spirochaetota bacterium]|nr:tocopherol cyclase family protein [Spirochaetota bacterium]HOL56429.1 tocopherol cyclase family protein [Spirochaetota bacterium]HPP03420.1 tocopherol cyclase family protein [Spirochaetota bacterium]
MFDNFINIWRPDNYHGHNKRYNFFEGWYYKLITEDRKYVIAIIPGIILSKKDPHSFIQFYNGKELNAFYFRYSKEEFYAKKEKFDIKIENNNFKIDGIKLNINKDSTKIVGELSFENIHNWPVKLFSPGIMGYFGLLPFMECYYQVSSFKHNIKGKLLINDKEIDFNNGIGYIEKNWGKSFPTSWIWLQANDFSENEMAFMFSIAKIPFLNFKFNGFVGAIFYNKKIYPFATYNNSKIENIILKDNTFSINVNSSKFYLKIEGEKKNGFYLPYPKVTGMDGKIFESLNSIIKVELFDKKNNKVIVSDRSFHAGIEISENVKELLV